ncbi:AAA family ATPase [Acidithiobacillus sp.]|uniref:AAA family ATPase n=1 Tax=Acidithiobacillus sp. TaxID=1872118 RepID=UPI0025C5816D|nr:AAA family ATPase [Acidithiobacillus sp.]
MFVWYTDLEERLPRLLDCLGALCASLEEKDEPVPSWVTRGLPSAREAASEYAGLPPQDWPDRVLEKTQRFALEMAVACIPFGDLAEAVQQGEGCWSPSLEFAWQWAMVAAQLGSELGEAYAVVLAARLRPKAYGTFLRDLFRLWCARLRGQTAFFLEGRNRIGQCSNLTLEMGLQAVARLEDAALAREVVRFLRERKIEVPLSLFSLQCALDRVLGATENPVEGRRARLVVLQSMQSPGKDDERRALERFRPLLRPLPLMAWPQSLSWADTLRQEFPWMEAAINALERQQVLAQRLGADSLRLRPLLLLGPAGMGKTRFLRRLGESLGAQTIFVPLAGSNDNMLLKGSARGWSNARPGFLVERMLEQRCPNPIVILDEIDKVGLGRNNGRVWETLLTLLEPASSRRVLDEFLLGEVDYSAISWVATANRLEELPLPLRSRWEIVSVGFPEAEDFDRIFENLQQDVAREYGVDPAALPALDRAVRDRLQRAFARNPRSLRALRGVVCRLLEMQAMAERPSDRNSGWLQ